MENLHYQAPGERLKKLKKAEQQRNELLELFDDTIKQLKNARYCIEDGNCAYESAPDWLFDIKEYIEEEIKKIEGDSENE